MSDKIELIRLCGVLQSKFLFNSQSESRTQPCHVKIMFRPLFGIRRPNKTMRQQFNQNILSVH